MRTILSFLETVCNGGDFGNKLAGDFGNSLWGQALAAAKGPERSKSIPKMVDRSQNTGIMLTIKQIIVNNCRAAVKEGRNAADEEEADGFYDCKGRTKQNGKDDGDRAYDGGRLRAGAFSIPVPMSPVPISLTNLVICFMAYVLGARRGTAACGLYLLLGAVGMPVFGGFSGGLERF